MTRRSLPYAKNSETSRGAADSMIAPAPSVRRRGFDFIASRGDYGATDDEIEIGLELSHQTASARRNLLVKDGAVVNSDAKRPTRSGRPASVWVAVEGYDITTKPGRPPKPAAELRSVKVTAYFDRESYADLCMLAAEQDRPVSQVIQHACRQYVDQAGGDT